MAIIGDAYVRIRAVTAGLEKDVKNAIDKSTKNLNLDLRKSINIDPPDTSGVRREFDSVERSAEATSGRVRASFLKNFGDGQISYLIRRIFYQIVWGTPIVGTLITALAQLGGAFLSLAASIGPALNALAVAPGLLAAVGTGVFSLLAAFSGVFKAYGAGVKAVSAGTRGVGAAAKKAKQYLTIDTGVRDALEAVKEAQKDLTRVIEDGNRRIAASQRDLTLATRDWKDAQDAVIEAHKRIEDARKAAAKNIISLQFAARQAAITEGQAAIDLERAREKLAEVSELPPNHRLRREAELAFQQAQLNLDEAKKANEESADASKEATEAGVDGSDQVKEARDAELKAIQDVKDAKYEMIQAEKDLQRTREEAALAQEAALKRIQDAQRRYQEELKKDKNALDDLGSAAVGAGGGVDQFANAMKNLSPEAQEFVRYLLSIRGEFAKLREAAGKELFPKLIVALKKIVGGKFLDLLATGLRLAGGAIGDVAIKIADLLNNDFFQGNLATIFESNVDIIKNLGDALVSLVDLITAVAAAAAPFTEELTKWLSTKIGDWAQQASENFQGLQDSIGDGVEVFKKIVGIFDTIKDAIGNLLEAARPAGDTLLDAFGAAMESFKTFTESDPDRLKSFFDNAAKSAMALGDLLKDAVNLFFRLSESDAAGESLRSVVSILRSEALPAIEELFTKLSESGTSEKIAHLFAGLIETLGELLDSGALDTFISIIQTAIDGLGELAEMPGFGTAIAWVGSFIGAWKAFNILAEITQIRKLGSMLTATGKSFKAFNDTVKIHQHLAAMGGKSVGKFGASLSVLGSKFTPLVMKFKAFGGAVKGMAVGLAKGAAALGGWIRQGALFLVQIAKMSAAWVVNTAKMLANKVATLAVAAAQKVVRAAAVAWTAVQWALNAAMSANPISLIVIAIGALVAAFVWLWNNVDGFRNFFLGAWKAIQKAVKSVIDWISKNWPTLVAIITGPIGFIVRFIRDNWETIRKTIKVALTAISNSVTSVFNGIRNFISSIWTGIRTAAATAWNLIRTGIRIYIDSIRKGFTTVFNGIKSFLSGIWSGIRSAAVSAWNLIKNSIRAVVDAVGKAITGVFDHVRDTVGGVWTSIRKTATDAWNGIVDWFRTNVSRISTPFSNIGDSISSGFKSAFNAIARFWNTTVGRLEFEVPDWVPGMGGKGWKVPDIPYLAKGGIVSPRLGGSLAMLGEAGRPEVVSPLGTDGRTDGERDIIEALENSSVGTKVYITINAQPNQDVQTLARIVSEQITFLGA